VTSISMTNCDRFLFSSRRRHTRCYRDWSSDVCSSDLQGRRLSLLLSRLDQRHDRGGIEVVKADDLVGAQGGLADLRDRQRGGVRSEERRVGGVEKLRSQDESWN